MKRMGPARGLSESQAQIRTKLDRIANIGIGILQVSGAPVALLRANWKTERRRHGMASTGLGILVLSIYGARLSSLGSLS